MLKLYSDLLIIKNITKRSILPTQILNTQSKIVKHTGLIHYFCITYYSMRLIEHYIQEVQNFTRF